MQELEWWQSQLKELKPWPAVHDFEGCHISASVRVAVAEAVLEVRAFRDAVLD